MPDRVDPGTFWPLLVRVIGRRSAGRGDVRRGLHRPAVRQQPGHEDYERRELRSLLEQQFIGCGGQTTQRILQVSNTFRYEQNDGAATCADRVGRMSANGLEVQPTDTFRVTMNSFLAAGGDGFTVFNQGR